MNGKLKIKEIATHTGLSMSTVSRVLAGKSNTSTKAKNLVTQYAKSHGILNDLYNGRLLINNLIIFAPQRAFDIRTDIFYYRIIEAINQALKNRDVRLQYCGIDENHSDTALFLEKITAPDIEAVIIIGIDDPHIHMLAADINKPCILINCYDKNMQLDCIAPDHRTIGEFSANYLIKQGHKKILTIMSLRRETMALRLAGIKDAYLRNNMLFDKTINLVSTAGFSRSESENLISQYFEKTSPEDYPTAILAGGEFISAGVINALKRLAISIPDDISVMSMDGVNINTDNEIDLTSLQVPCADLGREAIYRLQQRILQPNTPCSYQLLQGRLVIKNSVMPPKTHKNAEIIFNEQHKLYD